MTYEVRHNANPNKFIPMDEKSEFSSPFKPLTSKRVFEQVADQIRNLIVSGIFKPADKLPPEMELAGHFNVGRTALREALRVLESEGLIYVKQGSEGGSFVAEPDFLTSPKSIIEKMRRGEIGAEYLYEVRLCLEPQMLRYVIDRITDEDLDEMEKSIHDSGAPSGEGVSPVTRLSVFHLLIARASRNPFYEMLLGSMINFSVHMLAMGPHRPEFVKPHLDQHREILACLRERDLEKAQRALTNHIQRVLKNIKAIQSNENALPKVNDE